MKPITCYVVLSIFKIMPTCRCRVWLLRKLGASIGDNCRIHSVEFLNAERGFGRLRVGNDCYVGPGVLIDLAGTLELGDGTVVAARALLLSHDDAGSSHGSPLATLYPSRIYTTTIGKHCWIGAGSIVLGGTAIGEQCILAAGSVARGKLDAFSMYAGQPAVFKQRLASA